MSRTRRWGAAAAALLLAVTLATVPSASAHPPAGNGLSRSQRAVLESIARDTWAFYRADVDPTTHLPLDNLGPGTTRGTYTSRPTSASTSGRSSRPATCICSRGAARWR